MHNPSELRTYILVLRTRYYFIDKGHIVILVFKYARDGGLLLPERRLSPFHKQTKNKGKKRFHIHKRFFF